MSSTNPRVAIIGGGLAGLAAAVRLADFPLDITLIESRPFLGGRATSYQDRATGELIDNCQHVSMKCCTNLADFAKRTQIASAFRCDRQLNFILSGGKRYRFQTSRWLPAPLHLMPALWGLKFLTWQERLEIAQAMRQLMRHPSTELQPATIGHWLKAMQQSEPVIRKFWEVVLVSALGESLERASFSAARQVFVDGFMSHRDGYQIEIPLLPLGQLYGTRLIHWLQTHQIKLQTSTGVRSLNFVENRIESLTLVNQETQAFDYFVLAVPWRAAGKLLANLSTHPTQTTNSVYQSFDQIESSPITGVHLWYDRPITPLPHAVLVDRLSQWLFNRNPAPQASSSSKNNEHYYQVVISASRSLSGRNREEVIQEIHGDLQRCFPEAQGAQLLRWQMITEQHAVFSVTPELSELRPMQKSTTANLFLAGDWTQTGWPSTMEGAVRSGYLAAEALVKTALNPHHLPSFLAPDLPKSFLARQLIAPA